MLKFSDIDFLLQQIKGTNYLAFLAIIYSVNDRDQRNILVILESLKIEMNLIQPSADDFIATQMRLSWWYTEIDNIYDNRLYSKTPLMREVAANRNSLTKEDYIHIINAKKYSLNEYKMKTLQELKAFIVRVNFAYNSIIYTKLNAYQNAPNKQQIAFLELFAYLTKLIEIAGSLNHIDYDQNPFIVEELYKDLPKFGKRAENQHIIKDRLLKIITSELDSIKTTMKSIKIPKYFKVKLIVWNWQATAYKNKQKEYFICKNSLKTHLHIMLKLFRDI